MSIFTPKSDKPESPQYPYPYLVIQSEAEAMKVVERWQKILRVQDWDIRIHRGRNRDGDGVYAQIRTYRTLGTAKLFLVDWIDISETADPSWFDQEQAIVHELVHVAMDNLEDPERDTPQYNAMERFVDQMACTLVKMDRDRRGIPDMEFYRQP